MTSRLRLTDRLKVEHGIFLRQLRHLERQMREGAPREALAAVVDAIATAEEHHGEIEDRLLYPALEKVLGPGVPALQEIADEHREMRHLALGIRSGEFDESLVRQYVETLRAHIEREIHSLFVLAEECLTDEQLVGFCDWDLEHVHETAGKRAAWAERWLPAREEPGDA